LSQLDENLITTENATKEVGLIYPAATCQFWNPAARARGLAVALVHLGAWMNGVKPDAAFT
jgi:hypothetical protein